MLVIEKLKNEPLSNNERYVADYILEHIYSLKNHTVTSIAKETYTSPSTLVRIAHKLGYENWTKLKEKILEEQAYLDSHFTQIDANIPFTNEDNIMTIASKIAKLQIETINDTLSLMNHDDLQKAVQILYKADVIHVFAVASNLLVAKEFKKRMNRIGKLVLIHDLAGELYYDAESVRKKDCVIIISYTGETLDLVSIAKIIKKHHIPAISITNIGINSLASLTDVNLKMTTREKLFSKISTYSTDESIIYILNLLYSCIFAKNYELNWKNKTNTAKDHEIKRTSSNAIIKE